MSRLGIVLTVGFALLATAIACGHRSSRTRPEHLRDRDAPDHGKAARALSA